MNSSRVFLAISALLLAGQASAAQSDCLGVMWSNANEISSAKVIATDARVYFVANQSARTPMCPSPDRACRLRGFLVPGDDILVTATNGAYLCATFKSPKGVETSGWLPKAAVVVVAPKNLSAQDWDGEWRRDSEAEVILRSHGNELEISGAATWIGEATANEGQLTGNAEPRNRCLAIGYDPDKPGSSPLDGPGCAARLQLFGRYLVVDDNNKCGGLNVSFQGSMFATAASDPASWRLIRDARSHCRCYPQGLVHLDEVVPDCIEGSRFTRLALGFLKGRQQSPCLFRPDRAPLPAKALSFWGIISRRPSAAARCPPRPVRGAL